jgi:hypothetical protein
MTESGRKSGRAALVESLVADPWRKLAAIGLAVVLWLYLDSQVTERIELELRPRATDPVESSFPADASAGVTLHVLLPRQRFTVKEFRDIVTGQKIEQIRLAFQGPKAQIARLEEDTAGFTIAPDPGELDRIQDYFEFDERRVRARNPEFQKYLVGMTPRVVRAIVETRKSLQVVLDPERIMELLPDPNVDSSFAQRFQETAVTFKPTSVTLSGPEARLDEVVQSKQPLFEADLSRFARTTDSQVTLNLNLRPKLVEAGIEMHPWAPEATWRLVPSYTKEQVEVLVQLDALAVPEPLRAQIAYAPKSMPITLSIGPNLRAAIDAFTAASGTLEDWARQNLRLRVVVPADFNQNGEVIQPVLILLDERFKRSQDWEGSADQAVEVRREKE